MKLMNVYDLHAVVQHKSTEYSGIFVTKDTFTFIYSAGAQLNNNEHNIYKKKNIHKSMRQIGS